MTTLGKKPTSPGGSGGGKSTTSFSAASFKADSKSLQASFNQNGQKSSIRSTANTTKMTSGKDQVSFDFSKGQLSIKAGGTNFSLARGKDGGLNMSATDKKSNTTQTFGVEKGGKVTKTLNTPGKQSVTSISKDPHLADLAGKHSDRMGKMQSPFSAFKASPLGDMSGKGPDHSVGFSAFKRETKGADGKVTKSERGFKDLSSESGSGKSKTRTEPALGSGADGDLKEMQQKRGSLSPSGHRGRSRTI
jgi:hypothetical protein